MTLVIVLLIAGYVALLWSLRCIVRNARRAAVRRAFEDQLRKSLS
jgi:hypothetical protein